MTNDGLPLRSERLRVVYWLIALGLMGWLGIVLWQALAWTDLRKGLHHGIVVGGLISPFLLLLTAPLSAVGWALGRIRRFSRHQLAASLGVPAAVILCPAVSALMDRIHPERRFERFTGVPLPPGLKFEQVTFEGGIFPSNHDTYLFTCIPEETSSWIGRLKMEYRGDGGEGLVWKSGRKVHEIYGWHDTWKFVNLSTDSTRSVVEVTCGFVDY